MNPLIESNGLPAFSQIRPEHVKPALEHALEQCRNAIEQVVSRGGPYTWENLVLPVEEKDDLLERMWSPVSHLNMVKNSDELREAYEACLPLLSQYSTYCGQHQGLYQAYKSLKESQEYEGLSFEQQKVIDNTLRDFKLSGIALNEQDQQRYGELSTKISELGSKFSNNILDATHGWIKHVTDEAELKGLPEFALAAAEEAAKSRDLEGWVFTLDAPSYIPVMTFAENQSLREQMYFAFQTKASDQGPNAGKWDNTEVMEQILELRQQKAQLLGFANYAELSLATKMAESPEQVMSFLQELAEKSKAQGESEFAELTDFARQEHAVTSLNAWDLAYYSELLRQKKYDISSELLRQYFPENKVVDGLFKTANKVFGIDIKERFDFDSYEETVRFFDIFDKDGEHRGSFYLDLYAREKKRGGAWMDGAISRRVLNDGHVQKPVAYLVCNFNKPVGDKPALFSHCDVVTLFHEFGHGLHHMLTKVDASGVAGISGVAWDAVELPSQFLENWCWEADVLAYLSSHFETGEPLGQDLLDKMLAARNFQSAMMMLRQLEFSLFDFRIFTELTPDNDTTIADVLKQVRGQVSLYPVPDFVRFQHGFSHIFSGGYAAGYYSYKWAEVLSADAFSRFEEEGIFNHQAGQDFMQQILERGGSKEPMELFKAFRGREPSNEALLRHCGIKTG